jgi:GNAT superfamily N-acetyltransferase
MPVQAVRRYSLREVGEGDLAFMYDVKRAGLREYVEATWGRWDDAQQWARFVAGFTPAYDRIVVTDEGDVGTLCVDWDREPAFLAGIYLAPSVRRSGLGTAILRDIQHRARQEARPVELRVLLSNADARRLYERVGFVAYGTTPTHTLMRWTPEAG